MAQSLATEVREVNGAPALFINGKPDTGLTFYVTHHDRNREESADVAAAGVRGIPRPTPPACPARNRNSCGAEDPPAARIM